MSRISQCPLRRIAENELTQHLGGLGGLDDADLDDLATSLVRQWLTTDGHAGLITPTHQHWFQMVAHADGRLEVGLSTSEGNWAHILTRDWRVDEEDVPGLILRLNLCQSALFRNAAGLTIRLRVEPKTRAVRCEEHKEEAD
jgi:hypothetical protein